MKKILLLDPGTSFSQGGTRNAVRQAPHIGLISIAMAIKDLCEVRLLDMPLQGKNESDLRKDIRENHYDIVGITAATFNMQEACEAAAIVKSINPEILTVMGGPHPNADYRSVFEKTPNVDAAIVGEGEHLMRTLVETHGTPQFTLDLPGIAFKNKEGEIEFQHITPEYLVPDLDDLPFPDWDFLRIKDYWKRFSYKYDRMEQLVPISTIRGCPFVCSFCDPNNLTKKLRYRSPENVVQEIENSIENFNVRYFYITDSVMTLPKERFRSLCKLIASSGLAERCAFIGQSNINSIDEKMLDLYKEAGGEYIFFGIESGNENVLRLNGKYLKQERISRIVDHAHELGLHPRGSFILGLPYDTEQSILETIEFAWSLKLHSANFFNLDFYPGTSSIELLKEEKAGFKLPPNGIDWKAYVPSRNRAEVTLNGMSPERQQELREYAMSGKTQCENKELDFRQQVNELNYYAENGLLNREMIKKRYKNILDLKTHVSDKLLEKYKSRLKQVEHIHKMKHTSNESFGPNLNNFKTLEEAHPVIS